MYDSISKISGKDLPISWSSDDKCNASRWGIRSVIDFIHKPDNIAFEVHLEFDGVDCIPLIFAAINICFSNFPNRYHYFFL